jgi:hypothetical protein
MPPTPYNLAMNRRRAVLQPTDKDPFPPRLEHRDERELFF